MKLIYTPSAAKALRELPKGDGAALEQKLATFAADPYERHGWAKAFGGGAFRVRHGDYRAVVEIDQTEVTVVVVKIGNRKEVYK
jgi:mRNA interferase RelE/StbE